jgi:hypothetical protein
VGLRVPTWVTLKEVPGEFHGVAAEIAGMLGELVGSDRRNPHCSDQRFGIALEAGNRYKAEVSFLNESTGVQSQIMVEYGNLPIRCRFCWAFDHLLKDCVALDGWRKDGGKDRPSTSSEASRRN